MQAIGEAANEDPQEVKLLLQRYEMLAQYQVWLKARKAEGKRLPRNTDEMTELARGDMQKKHMNRMRARHRRF